MASTTFRIHRRPKDDSSDEETEEKLEQYNTPGLYPDELTKDNKICLVSGYTKEQYEDHIPAGIIKLFYDYYELSIYTKIDKNKLLNKLDPVRVGENFDIASHSYHNTNIKWSLIINPNGEDESDEGHFRYWLILMRPYPLNIKSISAVCKIAIYGDNNKIIRMTKTGTEFHDGHGSIGNNKLTLPVAELEKHESLIIESFLDIYGVQFRNDEEIGKYLTFKHDGNISRLLIKVGEIAATHDNIDSARSDLMKRLPFGEEQNREFLELSEMNQYIIQKMEEGKKMREMPKMTSFRNIEVGIDKEIVFEWKIDAEMLKEWKIAPIGQRYYSKAFGVGGNWCLWIAPKADRSERKDNVILALMLLRVSDGACYDVICQYKMRMICDGEESEYEEPAEFQMDSSFWHWETGTLLTHKLEGVSNVQIFVNIWNIAVQMKKFGRGLSDAP